MERECHGASPRERWSCLTTLYWHSALDSRIGPLVSLLCFGAAERLPSARAAQTRPFSFIPIRHRTAMRCRASLGLRPRAGLSRCPFVISLQSRFPLFPVLRSCIASLPSRFVLLASAFLAAPRAVLFSTIRFAQFVLASPRPCVMSVRGRPYNSAPRASAASPRLVLPQPFASCRSFQPHSPSLASP